MSGNWDKSNGMGYGGIKVMGWGGTHAALSAFTKYFEPPKLFPDFMNLLYFNKDTS